MLKYVYRLGQILVGLTLFLPLLVHDGFVFPFITPRNFLFRLLMSIGLGVIVLLWLNLKELRPKKNWINIAVASVIGAKFLSGIFGVNFYNSFWSSYERMEGILTWLFFGIFYFLIVTVFRKKEDWKWLFRISLIPALIIAFYGMGQAWGWELDLIARQSRIEAQLGNAAYVGAYMLIHIGIALLILLKDKNIWWRIGAGASLIPFHLAMFYSATRGAGLGWIVGIIVGLIAYLIFGKQKKLRLAIAGVFLVFIILGSSIWAARESNFVKNNEFLWRMTTIELSGGTVNSRLMIWNMAWKGFLERPIFGWGQDNFNYIFNLHYDKSVGEEWVDRAHNNLMDQLSMGGVVTFLAYLSVLIFPFYIYWKLRKRDPGKASLLLGFWLAYVIQNQFVFDSLNTYIYFFILLGFTLYIKKDLGNYEDQVEEGGMTAIYSTSYNRWILGMLLILVIIINAIFSWPGYSANRLTIKSLLERHRNPQFSYDTLRQAVDINSFGTKEIALQTTTLAYDVINNQKIEDEFKTKVVLFAIDALEKAAEREPEDVRILITLSSMYRTARVLDIKYVKLSEGILERARELSPRKQVIYYDLAQVKSLLGKDGEAEELLKSALEISPLDRYSLMNLISFQSRAGNPEALAHVQTMLGVHDVNFSEQDKNIIASAYLRFEKWNEAITFLKPLTIEFPDNVTYWQQIGQAYQATKQHSLLQEVDDELKRLDVSPLGTSTEVSN